MGIRLLAIVIGGGLGSAVRYLASLLGWRLFGPGFPVATLAVNVAGCLLIGVAFALAETRGAMSPVTRLFVMTGFLGGLTTFSTFALETVDYAHVTSLAVAALNVLLSTAGGLAAVVAGLWLGRAL
ncbi:MAG TPA: fluoride efflux transporter CrcB [Thermoleophilia bacterium]|nr:fluoride efflux transporter CrcB [Thermoleophilia bacterium]